MSAPDFRLDARTALVTGAVSGIGRAIAVGLAESGAAVCCLDLPGPGLDATRTAYHRGSRAGCRTHRSRSSRASGLTPTALRTGRSELDRIARQRIDGSTWSFGLRLALSGRSPASTAPTPSSPTVPATSGRGSTAPLA